MLWRRLWQVGPQLVQGATEHLADDEREPDAWLVATVFEQGQTGLRHLAALSADARGELVL